MKNRVLVLVTLSFCLIVAWRQTGGSDKSGEARSSLARLSPIDAHAHIFNSSPRFSQLLNQLNMRLVNICVVDLHDPGFEKAEPQHAKALELFRQSKGRWAWCSTFDPRDWEKAGFAERVIRDLDPTFKNGAVAVKIYKDIGMELRSRSGRYLMPDDPVFTPILEFIESRGKTLYAHIAEPTAAWKPLDPKSPHYSYYKANPDWHMYLHPDRPAKETILSARDRLLERHPKLRVVGAHLGSMEDDVDQIARRFERYPNFVVDTAARVPDLMIQPREKVRAFLTRYQDRVLYATDLVLMPTDNPDQAIARWEEEYLRDWKYFATDGTVVYQNRQIKGLALPEAVLVKLYRLNAEKWVPGLKNPGNATGNARPGSR